MFRPLTIIAITAFCVVGWNVYRAEDSARQLDRELRDLTRRIEQARDRTQVLKAEWALLNEPERLRVVAQKYLPLETMTPAQFIRLADLGGRLPVAMAFSGPVNLFGSTGETAVAEATPAKPAAPTAVAAATPAPAAEAPAPAVPPVRLAARSAP
ncbi:cell division protein FtsL, partial [Pseudoroseomonas ludipueritiae]